MKTHLSKRILALLLTLIMVLSLLPMTFAEEEAPKSGDLVILYTNDVHCGVDQNDSSIGVAGLAKVKKELEAAHENVALVDNGDFIQGELIGTVSRGEYLVQIMNYLGYDYGTFGNHEYDYTMPQLKTLVDLADMTYLSCNFQYIGPGEDPNAVDVPGYKVVDYNGLKVGYVGITTPESLVKSTPTYFQDENGEWIYTFCNGGDGQDLYDAVQAAVDAARAEGAQVVVALAHLGIDEQSSPWMSTEVIANTTGIDVMLDGHSHSTIARQEVANKNGETVLLSSTGTKLANIGKLTITPEGAVNTELIARSDVDGVDEDTQAYLNQIKAEFEELQQQVVAHTGYDLLTTDPDTGARMVRMRETNLGDVCADAYRTILDADVAFVNGGGVRANIPAGDVTYEQIIKVHPYSNMACKIKTTGQQILDALEMASRNVTVDENGNLAGENGGFLQVAGLKYTINADIASTVVVDESKMFVEVAGERRVEDVQILQADGSYLPIDPEGEYTLASHNYMLKQAGDGINMFMHDELLLDEVKVDNQVLIEYMTSEDFAAHDYSNWEGEGRIKILSANTYAGKTIILHTNDTHGALMGFAQVAQVKADLEAQGATVILVDAGDFSQGTTYVSTNKGAAAVTMMNAAGYDVVTLGNHEFDFGYAQLMQNLETAEFTAICADVFEGDETILPAYTVKEFDGLKIGFFGMETPETQTKVNPGLITEISFGTAENGRFLSSARDAVAALQAEGADLIIGIVHLGVDAESEPYRSVDLFGEVEGIDFLIDGHSHTVMTEGPSGEPIQSTGTKASATAFMNVGCLVIDNETKTIEKNELIPLGEGAPVDGAVAAKAQEIMDAVDAEYGAVFAQSAVELNGDKAPNGNRDSETNLGDLITDALLWSVMKDMDAETLGVPAENVVAITNGGGIRAWIHEGDVTMNDVNTVLPFGNTVAVVYVTGAELLEALEASTYCTPTAVGGFPQISGMNITLNVSKTFDAGELYPGSTYHKPNSIRRVTINSVNGMDFDPEATYAVVTNNFCAAGGDTYYVFKNASSQFDTGIPMDEALMEFIKDPTFMNGYISDHYAEPQGRIKILKPFKDVQDPDQYYYTPVYWAYNHEPEITAGKSKTKFGVGDPCTREQIVTFLWKAYGAEEPTLTENKFKDVSEDAYYYKAVLWAKEKGITAGMSKTKFGVGSTCTRAEAVTFLWAAAGKPEPVTTNNPFKDVTENDYFYKAVLWAVENGVTAGTSAHKFSPKRTCTREQIVTFLYAAIEKDFSAEIKVFETTDIHGYLLDASSLNEETFQYRLAFLSNIFNQARASEEYDDVLLLDGGDIYQGTPVSNLLQGNAIRAALDKMGYDAVALGNHEFDWGVTENADEQGTIPAYEIGEFSGDPDIPVLAYNLYDAETGEPVPFTQDYVVVEKAGYRIAIIGYIPNYRGDIMAARINPYTIDEDLTKLAEKVHEINETEKPDVTIVLAHESPRGIANAMDPEEVDLVAGGHSHSASVGVAENGIPYIQGNCQAKGYSSATIVINRKGAEKPTVTVEDPLYTDTTSSANRPNLYDTPENADKLDPEILAISHAAWEAVKDDMEEVLGYVDVNVDKTKVSDNGATVAGNWISGLMLRGTADLGSVASFYNSGGIRTTFKIAEGETTRNITTADIYTINPFDNCWLVYELTGAEIAQQLLNGFINGNFGDQMSGLTFTYWQEGSGRDAVRGIVSITLDDGTEIDPTDNETTYRVCTSNYSATLDGSVFLGKEPLVPIADAPVDNVTIIELLRAEGLANEGYLAVDTGVRGTLVEKPEVQEPVEFEFLVTSDLHGQIYATDYTAPYANSGTYSRGLTRVATYIKEQKEAFGDNVYVVDMGDTFQGAPLTYYYAFNKPEEKDPAILAFRTIGYDMWVVGNHEFNYGLEILTRQMDYAVSEGDENEKQLTISLANYLKAETNSDESKDWATWRDVAPYVIKDFDGYKVAVIGFGNPNIPKWDVPANWEGIYFANIIETYQHYEAEMLEQADMIVVVAHSGIDSDPGSDFIRELVASTNTIAFAFSGHEHRNGVTNVENTDGKTIPILSPYTKARRIAQVKVTVNGDEITVEPEIKNMENYPIDEDLAALLEPYEIETWEGYMLQPIGTALGDYPAANLGTAPSAFMDLINTVQTWGAYDRGGVNTPDNDKDDAPAMLSISAPLTSGSNANLISEGPIVLGDMFGLYRFENWFYQITMTGEEVHQWLEFAATKVRIDGEGNPYVTSGDLTYYDVIMGDGFHYDIDVSKPEGERVINMRYQGQPVEADQVFTVVVNNYRYNGGGNYVMWLNEHGCEFIANDPDRIIYSTQFDMIQGEDEGQARALLVSYIKEQTAANGGITPFITSDWTVQNGYVAPEPPAVSGYVVAESVEANDQILYVVEYNGNLYAMTNDTSVSNALNVAEVTVNEDGVIETAPDGAVWTLETGTAEQSFVLKDEDGKYLSNPSSTGLKLGDSKTDFTVTCGAGTSAFNLVTTSTTARRIFLRNNNSVLQFRCYAVSNAESEGYSSVLTIYKYVP